MSDTLLARVFALASDREQAEFLNVAGQTLRAACKINGGFEDMQLCRITDNLNDDGRRFVKMLAAYVEEGGA